MSSSTLLAPTLYLTATVVALATSPGNHLPATVAVAAALGGRLALHGRVLRRPTRVADAAATGLGVPR